MKGRRRNKATNSQSPERQRKLPPQDERADKINKVQQRTSERRTQLCKYYIPRIVCCSILLMFMFALSYRLTDRVVLPSRHDRNRPTLPKGSNSHNTNQRSKSKSKSKSKSNSMLLNRRDTSSSSNDPLNDPFPTNPRETLRLEHHAEHLKQHGNLITAAKIHSKHQLGPHAPHLQSDRNTIFSESERQGNKVTHLKDDNGNDAIITNCKEYLGDHVHCKPILDMTALRSVQQEYDMSDKLFDDTLQAEIKRWIRAFEVGLSTSFMKLRLIEVAHNYQLKRKRKELLAIGDASSVDQHWRYKHTLRHVNFMSHNKASFSGIHLNMDRELPPKKRELLAAYAFQGLKELYIRLGIPKHDTTVQQIVYKYVRKHDLLDALVTRLEKRYAKTKQQELVAHYLYPVQAGARYLLIDGHDEWPGTKKNQKIINSTLIVQEEMDAVNWMFKKLHDHRLEVKLKKEVEKTRKTCIFSHTNDESPCFPTHPCAKIKHGARTRAIIVKCFWRIARPYCEKNQRNAGALVNYQHFKKKEELKKKKKKIKDKQEKAKMKITEIDGIPINKKDKGQDKVKTKAKDVIPSPLLQLMKETGVKQEIINDEIEETEEAQEENDEEKKDANYPKEDDDDDADEEEKDAEDEEDEEDEEEDEHHDPYDAEDLDEFDEACSHVIQDTFVDGIAWFESQGLRPELEEKDQKMKEDKEKKKLEEEERRKHKFLPTEDKKDDIDANSMSIEAKNKEDMLIAKLPPAKSSIHNLLTKKSTMLKSVGGLKSQLKKWYVKHGLIDKSKDDVHLTELSKKYIKHQDLLFTRLHVKYHQTKD